MERTWADHPLARRIAVSALAFAHASLVATGAVVFEENFESDKPLAERGWKVDAKPDQSVWKIEQGLLRVEMFKKPYDGGEITRAIPKIRRGYLEFDVRYHAKAGSGMGLKIVVNGLMVAFDNKQKAMLSRYIPPGDWKDVATREFDQWHKYRVFFDLDQGEAAYFVDDMKFPVHRETDRRDLKESETLVLANYGLHDSEPSRVDLDNLRLVSEPPAASSSSDAGGERIPIHAYEMKPEPDSRDPGRSTLLDGRTAAALDRDQLKWKEFSGEVEILVELQEKRAIGAVSLAAFASPANNLARVTLQVERDGKWETASLWDNAQDQTGLAAYTVTMDGPPAPVSRLKLLVTRGVYDRPMYLSEVMLHPPGSAAQTATDRPALVAGEADELKQAWTLSNAAVRFDVSKRTGRIVSGWHAARNERVIRSGDDRYFILTDKETTPFAESADRVTKSRHEGGTLTLTCENPGLPGFAIQKRYRLDGPHLRKEVTFRYRGAATPRTFLIYAPVTAFADDFWRDAILVGRDGLSGMVPAREIRFSEAAPTRLSNKMLLLVNYRKGFGVAQHRLSLDGRYLLPWEARAVEPMYNPYFLPGGWRIGMMLQKVESGMARTVESACTIFDGTPLDFWRGYRQMPEVERSYRALLPRPEWMARVKAMQFASFDAASAPGGATPEAREMAETFEEGEIIFVLWSLGVMGDYAEDTTYNVFGGLMRAEDVKRQVESVKAVSPRLRAGLYVFDALCEPHARVFREHPDWFITQDRFGQPVEERNLALVDFSATGVADHWARMYDRLMRRYNLDFVYMDGGGLNTVVHWQKDRVYSAADKQRFFEQWRAAVLRTGNDRGLFFNERLTPFADGGFVELPHGVVSGDWRKPADIFHGAKVLQAFDPTRWISPLYWSDEHQPFYANYLIGLGLTPGHAFEPKDVPYITAAFETRDLRLVEANLAPDWRADWQTQVEAFAFTQGNAGIVSVINHNPTQPGVAVSFDPRRVGLREGTTAYPWLFRMMHPKHARWIATEKRQRETYGESGWGLSLVVAGEPFPAFPVRERFDTSFGTETNSTLHMLVVTGSPGVVWSVNGRRTHLWLPTMLGVNVSGRLDADGRALRLDVDCAAKSAEVLARFPQEWPVGAATINGRRVDTVQPVLLNGQRFLLVPVAHGKNAIEIRAEPGEVASVVLGDLKATGEIRAGGSLRLTGEIQGASGDMETLLVTVRNEASHVVEFAGRLDAKVAGGKFESASLAIPTLIWGGDYRIEVAGRAGPVADVSVSLPNDKRGHYPYQPGKLPVAPPTKQVQAVNRSLRGIEALQSAVEYALADPQRDPPGGSTRGAFAELNLDELEFTARYPVDAHSRFGHGAAGIECRGLRLARLDIRSFFPERVVTHEIPYHAIAPPNFAGIIVDYHTPGGYTKRVALSFGVCTRIGNVSQPSWGKGAAPDQVIELADGITREKEFSLTVDLGRYAPPDWDGRVWFAPTVFRLLPGGGFRARLSPLKEAAGAKIDAGTDISELFLRRRAACESFAGEIAVDGALDEPGWREATELGNFRQLVTARKADPNTAVKVWRGATHLYVGFTCAEKEKKRLFKDAAADAGPWADDSVEVFLAQAAQPENYFQFVVSHTGKKHSGRRFDPVAIPWEAKTRVDLAAGVWTVEIAIPFESLGWEAGEGASWRANFCRSRPLPGGGFDYSAWAGFFGGGFHEPQGFGELRFPGAVRSARAESGASR